MRVLLVDDEHNLRRLLARVLFKNGLEVIEFASSLDALEWSRNNDADVLVTDVMLSDLDGSRLAEAVATRNPELLVVFMSGMPFDIEAERRKHAYCAYVEKPFAPRTLLAAISELVDERQRGSKS